MRGNLLINMNNSGSLQREEKVLPDPCHCYLALRFRVRQPSREENTTSTTLSSSSHPKVSFLQNKEQGTHQRPDRRVPIPSPPPRPLQPITSLLLRLYNLMRRHSPCSRAHCRRGVTQVHLVAAVCTIAQSQTNQELLAGWLQRTKARGTSEKV